MAIVNWLCTTKQFHKTYGADVNLYPAPTGTAETTKQFAATQYLEGYKPRHLSTWSKVAAVWNTLFLPETISRLDFYEYCEKPDFLDKSVSYSLTIFVVSYRCFR
jgi:hypothetical protein